MATTLCNVCGSIGMSSGGDGFYYCLACGTQSQDLREQALGDDEMVFHGIYNASYQRKARAPVQSQADIDIQTQVEVLAKMQKINRTGGENFVRPADADDSDDEILLRDFGPRHGSHDALDPQTLASQIRERYLEGIQKMIQMQCEALVEKFGVSPLICGVTGSVWLRFVASTRVLERGWAQEVLQAADALHEEYKGKDKDPDLYPKDPPVSRYSRTAKFKAEPRSHLYGEKARVVWARSLKDRIPLAISLVVSFLACHIAREAILPTDIVKWVLEGKIPYLAAFMDIEKSLGGISKPWPLSPKFLLRPYKVLGARQLELMAGCLVKRIGLQLPSVNFHSISLRFLKQLRFPVDKIFLHVERMHEWSAPPGLWLSANPTALPTRVYVMSMLVVVIRILYNIHGQGYWEQSLATNSRIASVSCHQSSNREPSDDKLDDKTYRLTDHHVNGANFEDNRFSTSSIAKAAGGTPTSSTRHRPFQDCELDATTMLQNLESWDQNDVHQLDYARDLPSYLKYCKDVIFCGSKMSYDEENLIKHFWQLYEKMEKEDLDTIHGFEEGNSGLDPSTINNRHKSESHTIADNNIVLCQNEISGMGELECSATASVKQVRDIKKEIGTCEDMPSRQSSKSEMFRDKTLESVIFDMEQNGFQYIPPVKDHPSDSYLRYRKKTVDGKLKTFVHADYFILLRACARLIKVDSFTLHRGVWKVEKRIGWIEDCVGEVIQAIKKQQVNGD